MIVQYFRKYRKKHNFNLKKGVMVALPITKEGIVKFGYSLCYNKDKFDETFGLKVAIRRALCNRPLKIPHSMKKSFDKFKIRCGKYYKQLKIEYYTI